MTYHQICVHMATKDFILHIFNTAYVFLKNCFNRSYYTIVVKGALKVQRISLGPRSKVPKKQGPKISKTFSINMPYLGV